MQNFVQNPLTRRQVVSKFSALFGLLGKLTPVTTAMKLHIRQAVKETSGWDDAVSPGTRSHWIMNLWRLFKLQGLKFNRGRIPSDAVDTKMYLQCFVDAADN